MSTLLKLCNGPACPYCGCRDARILVEPKTHLGSASWFGAGKARCNHCGKPFSFREMPSVQRETIVPAYLNPYGDELQVEVPDPEQHGAAVDHAPERPPKHFPGNRCPKCGGIERVTSTRPLYRWKKCVECGNTRKDMK